MANGQNATDGAVSTPAEIMLPGLVERVGRRYNTAAKGLSLGGWATTLPKLQAACAAELKSLRGLGESRLPADVHDALIAECNKFVDSIINTCVNRDNFTKVTSRVTADFNTNTMFVRKTAVGKTYLALKEQALFNKIAIREAEERLARCKTPEAEEKAKIRIAKLEAIGYNIAAMASEANS